MKFKLLIINILLYNILLYVVSATGDTCPRRCDCDMFDSMRRARCSNQQLVNIDTGVPKYVQILELDYNFITALDNYGFRELQLTSLVKLNLSHNSIHVIGLEAFTGLNKMVVLDMSYNRLQELPYELLSYNHALKELYLKGNKFWSLSSTPFLQSASLEILDLSQCQLNFLYHNVFQDLQNLIVLDLSNNNLIELNIFTINPLKHLKILLIANNALECNNKQRNFEDWIKKNAITMTPICSAKHEKPKMFEKMISIVVPNKSKEEMEEVDINTVWGDEIETFGDITYNSTNITDSPNRIKSFREKFNKSVQAEYSMLLGLILGMVLGSLTTYCCVSCSCKCSRPQCPKIRTRRQRHRAQRVREQSEANLLLWSNFIANMPETPPITRRADLDIGNRNSFRSDAFSGSSRNSVVWTECSDTPSSNGDSWEYYDYNPAVIGAVRVPPGTPPPPYADYAGRNRNI